MTEPGYPATWRRAFDELHLSTTPAEPPPQAYGDAWAQLIARFTRRGFLRVLCAPDASSDGIAIRAEIVLPEVDRSADFAHELADALKGAGATSASVISATPPTQTHAVFPGDLSAEATRNVLLKLLKVSDFVQALEDDPRASSPLRDADAAPPSSAVSLGGFETIGDRAPAEDERHDPPREPRRTHSAFEPIGDAPPRDDRRDDRQDDRRDDRRDTPRRGHHLRALGRDEVELSVDGGDASPAELAALRDALTRAVRSRYDVDVLRADVDAHAVIILGRPGAPLDSKELERWIDDLHGYLDRLRRFDAQGVSVLEVLDVRNAPVAPRRDELRRDEPRRDEPRRDEPRRDDRGARERDWAARANREAARRKEAPADRGGSGGVVLDLSGGGAASAPTGASGQAVLTPGDFTDERLRRPDATTSLVDVVLRHPGYSDRAIGQVLSILLSIDYSKALRTAERAPCVVAWGLSQERAQTFKNVIEGAGGKAVLVEPGAFGQD